MSAAEIEHALNAPAAVNKDIAARRWGQDARKKPTVPRAANGAAAQADFDRLLQLHGRDLRKQLAEVDEAVWPALLEAYDAYITDPTAQRHRRWITIWQDALPRASLP